MAAPHHDAVDYDAVDCIAIIRMRDGQTMGEIRQALKDAGLDLLDSCIADAQILASGKPMRPSQMLHMMNDFLVHAAALEATYG